MHIIPYKSFPLKSSLTLLIALLLFSEVAVAFNYKIGGQVNRAVRWADNGEESGTQIVDNSTSETSIKLHISQEDEEFKVGSILKFRLEGSDSANYDINGGSSNSESVDVSHAFLYAKSSWGKISFGRGNHADRGTTRADLSGTDKALNNDHRLYSGIRLFEGMTFSGFRLGDFAENYDGDRSNRIQYVSPSFDGFKLKASYAPDGEVNTLALGGIYNTQLNGTGLKVGFGYNHVNGDPGSSVDDSAQFGISASALLANGLSFTGAYGKKDIENSSPSFDRSSTGYYGKIGYRINETTTLAFDIGSNDDAAFDDSEATFYGLGKQKRFNIADCEGQAYLSYRHYEFDTPGPVSPDDVDSVTAGLMIDF